MKYLKIVLIVGVGVFFLSLCCKQSSDKVVLKDFGFSMTIPAGWQIDKEDNTLFFDTAKPDDNAGVVIDYELKSGESLNGFVDLMIAEDQALYEEQKQLLATLSQADSSSLFETRILSRKELRISGREAIELLSAAEYVVLEIFVVIGSDVVNVSFRSLPEDYSKSEPLFRKAIESIRIQSN